jgi:hypothetical protein
VTVVHYDRADKPTPEMNMIGSVARWGHNVLLAAMALVTIGLLVLAK